MAKINNAAVSGDLILPEANIFKPPGLKHTRKKIPDITIIIHERFYYTTATTVQLYPLFTRNIIWCIGLVWSIPPAAPETSLNYFGILGCDPASRPPPPLPHSSEICCFFLVFFLFFQQFFFNVLLIIFYNNWVFYNLLLLL